MLRVLLVITVTFSASFMVIGQTTRDVAPTPPAPKYQANKKVSKKKSLFKKLFSKKVEIKTAQEETIEFRKKIKKNLKAKAKAEKKNLDPQFTDPLYFGHKKPPKKRKNGKKKFCKECGLRH